MLALTMGEPAGIGGELTLKAWTRLRETGPAFAALDDPDRLHELDASVPLAPVASLAEAEAVFRAALPVLPTKLAVSAVPGHPDPANAGPVLASIERAVRLACEHQAAGVVTNPISKS